MKIKVFISFLPIVDITQVHKYGLVSIDPLKPLTIWVNLWTDQEPGFLAL